MEQEEYIVDEHKVTHRVHLGDKEIFLAVQQDVNSTPFVRQYGKLLTNGVLFYAKRGS